MNAVLRLALACAIFLAHAALAAVPVEESVGSRPGQPGQDAAREPSALEPLVTGPDAPEPPAGATGTAALFHQLQLLEQEMQTLRGLVEEQRHRIDQLERQQKEQYLDVDRRLQQLSSGGAAPAVGSAAAGQPSGLSAAGSGEREAFRRAFDLTRERSYDEAIAAFRQQIADYPNGELTANAYYWLGQLYMALPEPDLEEARQAFAQVVNLFPTHEKAPDAMFKLGVVYHQLGDLGTAVQYLNRVQARHPDSPAARLAESYAAELR